MRRAAPTGKPLQIAVDGVPGTTERRSTPPTAGLLCTKGGPKPIVPGVASDHGGHNFIMPHRDAYGLNIGRLKPVWRKHAKVYRLVTWKPIGDTSNG